MKKLLISIVITLLLFPNAAALAQSSPQAAADGALLIDVNSSKVLYEKNQHTRFYPASTTKIMTALLVLENCKLDEKVIIGKNPSSFVDGNKIYVFEGEEFTVDQLLHALLIASANDVAIALAEHVAGSVEAFAKMMNEKARQLGCLDTHFVNPNGLDDPNHYTTAYDLSLVAREAMKYDAFREIVSTKSYTMPPTNKQPKERPFYTNVYIMLNNRYHVDGATGMKVGYTDIAGHSFVGSAIRGDTSLLVVLLHDQTKPGMWTDASTLLKYGFDSYKTVKEVSSGDFISSFNTSDPNIHIPLVAKNDFYYTYPLNKTPIINSRIVITSDENSAILKGQDVGYIEYSDNGSVVGKVKLLAAAEPPVSLLYNHKETNDSFFGDTVSPWVALPVILILGALGVIRYGIRRKKRSL